MPVQNLLRFFERRAYGNRDQIIFGHHFGDRQIVAVSNRRSRFVRMPTRLPFLVTGTPEIR